MASFYPRACPNVYGQCPDLIGRFDQSVGLLRHDQRTAGLENIFAAEAAKARRRQPALNFVKRIGLPTEQVNVSHPQNTHGGLLNGQRRTAGVFKVVDRLGERT